MSGEMVDESFVELPGPSVVEVPLRNKIGPCDLGATCTAKEQELSDEYRCRYCNKQLHGFISGCSQAKNENDFRDGVICKVQPCGPSSSPAAGGTTTSRGQSSKSDGVVRVVVLLVLQQCGSMVQLFVRDRFSHRPSFFVFSLVPHHPPPGDCCSRRSSRVPLGDAKG
jgi:hypothetical protein